MSRHSRPIDWNLLLGMILTVAAGLITIAGVLNQVLTPHQVRSAESHPKPSISAPAYHPTPPLKVPQRPVQRPIPRDYRVRAGDTLWKIAVVQLGNGLRWHHLWMINIRVIGPNPNRIYPGQILMIGGP